MFGKFLPRDTSFFDLFEQHSALILKAAEEFHALASSNSFFNSKTMQEHKNWEHDADAVVHECAEALHKTFITPIDREDILRLISTMDDIIDSIDAAFDCLVIYKIENSTQELQKLSHILLQAVSKITFIVQGLRSMKNASEIRENCRTVRSLEAQGDATLRNAIGKLFEEEPDTRVVIKLKEIYETLENAIDSCHKVANIVEGIILEYD